MGSLLVARWSPRVGTLWMWTLIYAHHEIASPIFCFRSVQTSRIALGQIDVFDWPGRSSRTLGKRQAVPVSAIRTFGRVETEEIAAKGPLKSMRR